jgi:membrane protein YdbS with pleckstrin-like domain
MHCSNCGSYIAPGVRFCSGCGSPANDPEATRLARAQRSIPVRLDDENDDIDDNLEEVIFTVRPTLIFIKFGYALAVVGAITLVFLLALIPLPPYISILLGLSLLLIPAYYHVKRNTIRYTLTDSKVEIDTGLIARTTRNIPLIKIQDVTVSASILQRLLGFGDLLIDNASELGGTTVLHNISHPRRHADLLLRELRRWH